MTRLPQFEPRDQYGRSRMEGLASFMDAQGNEGDGTLGTALGNNLKVLRFKMLLRQHRSSSAQFQTDFGTVSVDFKEDGRLIFTIEQPDGQRSVAYLDADGSVERDRIVGSEEYSLGVTYTARANAEYERAQSMVYKLMDSIMAQLS